MIILWEKTILKIFVENHVGSNFKNLKLPPTWFSTNIFRIVFSHKIIYHVDWTFSLEWLLQIWLDLSRWKHVFKKTLAQMHIIFRKHVFQKHWRKCTYFFSGICFFYKIRRKMIICIIMKHDDGTAQVNQQLHGNRGLQTLLTPTHTGSTPPQGSFRRHVGGMRPKTCFSWHNIDDKLLWNIIYQMIHLHTPFGESEDGATLLQRDENRTTPPSIWTNLH